MTAIIDYDAGNLTSVYLSLKAAGERGVITSDASVIRAADHLIFPGVGAAASAMTKLTNSGLADTIRERINAGTPFLGICLGTQILFEHSEEDGGVDMLGLFPGSVPRFCPSSRRDKVPHIGWNQVKFVRHHPIFDGIEDCSDFYFIHSYYPAPSEIEQIIGKTSFGGIEFASAVGFANVVATQFHIEKSGPVGLRALANFLAWRP